MHQLMQLPDFRGSAVAHRRVEATKAPSAPPPEVLATFVGCPIYAAPLPEDELPKWLRKMC
eukprot:1914601-Heterocapsa_arctica.AAC.1